VQTKYVIFVLHARLRIRILWRSDDNVVGGSKKRLGFHLKTRGKAVPFSGLHIVVTEMCN